MVEEKKEQDKKEDVVLNEEGIEEDVKIVHEGEGTEVVVQDEPKKKKKRKTKKQKKEEVEPETYDETQEQQEEEGEGFADEEINSQLEKAKPEPKYEGIIIKDNVEKKLHKKNLTDKTEKYPYIKTNYNNDFKNLIKLLNGIKDEHTLKFTEKQLTITTIDETHTTLININIDYHHPMFEEMEIPYPMELTIDTKTMNDVLKAFNSSITIIPQDNTITIKDNVKTYKFATLVNENSMPHIPDIDKNLSAHTKISINCFKDVVRDCHRVSEHLCFATKKGGLVVSGENESDTVFFECIIPQKDIEHTVAGEGRSMFNVDLLEKLFSVEHLSSELELKFGTDMPLKILCDIEEGYGDKKRVYGDITYLVAPRIESE